MKHKLTSAVLSGAASTNAPLTFWWSPIHTLLMEREGGMKTLSCVWSSSFISLLSKSDLRLYSRKMREFFWKAWNLKREWTQEHKPGIWRWQFGVMRKVGALVTCLWITHLIKFGKSLSQSVRWNPYVLTIMRCLMGNLSLAHGLWGYYFF